MSRQLECAEGRSGDGGAGAGVPAAGPALAQDATQVSNAPQGGFTLKVNSDLVLTNVVVRDAKTGELVHGLKQSDFSIFENGKQQQIDTFDFESVDMATPLKEATVSGLAAGPSATVRKQWWWPSLKSCAITG